MLDDLKRDYRNAVIDRKTAAADLHGLHRYVAKSDGADSLWWSGTYSMRTAAFHDALMKESAAAAALIEECEKRWWFRLMRYFTR